REDDVVAPAAGERLAHDLFGLALRVDVGGVDEGDAGVEPGVDDADRLVVVGVAPGAEHHGSEAELADRHAGPAEEVLLHGQASWLAGWAGSSVAAQLPSSRSASSWREPGSAV